MRLEPQVSFYFNLLFYLLTIITSRTEWNGRNIGTQDRWDGRMGGLETRLEPRYVSFTSCLLKFIYLEWSNASGLETCFLALVGFFILGLTKTRLEK
jgi:hypothetical protein